MTKQEIVEAVTLIVMSYPTMYKDETAVQAMGEIWYRLFKDDNSRLVRLAIEKHIALNKWPPSVAEVREQMIDISHPEIIPPDIAWAAVVDLLTACGEYGYNGKPLPPMIQQCVDTIGWHTLYELHRGSYRGNKDGLDRVTFMELYKPAYERARESAMLPKELAEAVQKADKVLGADTRKQLEAVRKMREEKEDCWQQAMNRSMNEIRELVGASDEKLLEGNNENDELQTS